MPSHTTLFRLLATVLMCVVSVACAGEPDDAGDRRRTLSRVEAIERYWDEIRERLDGSETVEACSVQRPNCYDLEADISDGVIEIVHFSNGGFLRVAADIDSDGNASDVDQRGTPWDFIIDMDSTLVDEAVRAWAAAEGYEID